MGILGTFIGILIIVIVVAFAWQYIQGFVFEIITEGQRSFTQVQTSNKIKTTAQPDELVCDLAITTRVELSSVFTEGSVNPPVAKEYVWSDCNPTSAIPFASLLDINFGDLIDLMQLNIFTEGLVDQNLQTVIRLQDRETGELRDQFTDGNLKQTQDAPIGVLEGSKVFSEDFFIKNIPSRDYDLEIFYTYTFDTTDFTADININGAGVGAPVKERICAVGLTSC